MSVDEGGHAGFGMAGRAMAAALQLLTGEFSEPA